MFKARKNNKRCFAACTPEEVKSGMCGCFNNVKNNKLKMKNNKLKMKNNKLKMKNNHYDMGLDVSINQALHLIKGVSITDKLVLMEGTELEETLTLKSVSSSPYLDQIMGRVELALFYYKKSLNHKE